MKELKKFLIYIKLKTLMLFVLILQNRGKPHPDQLKYVSKNADKAQNTIYVGDMYVDFLASKNAKMKFVFAKYGYGEIIKNTHKINSLSDLKYI